MEKLIKGTNATTQEIAAKVNELVEWVTDFQGRLDDVRKDREELKARVGTTKESSATKYPDFKKWEEDDIVTDVWTRSGSEETFLSIAPEDFYIEKDGERQYHFTWDEAMKLEEEVLKPNGWRLPTCKELAQLCATYINDKGEDDVKRFMEELNVEMRGWKDANDTYGNDGNWWSSTATSTTSARYLFFASGRFYPQEFSKKVYGFAVRPVEVL